MNEEIANLIARLEQENSRIKASLSSYQSMLKAMSNEEWLALATIATLYPHGNPRRETITDAIATLIQEWKRTNEPSRTLAEKIVTLL